jgi:hypothetical protein
MSTPTEALEALVLCGLMGMVGQGIRAIAGLKKVNDQARDTNVSSVDLFIASRLVFSLIIGFIAGVIAGIATNIIGADAAIDIKALLGIAAAGYAGTDFVEAMAPSIIADAGAKSSNNLSPASAPIIAKSPPRTILARAPVEGELAELAVAPTPQRSPCGNVKLGAGRISAAQIKALVLQRVAQLPGAAPNPSSADSTKISDLINSDNPSWDLAVACMRFGRFDTDGLNCMQTYFITNGKTLGAFVQCIQCCYQHPMAET